MFFWRSLSDEKALALPGKRWGWATKPPAVPADPPSTSRPSPPPNLCGSHRHRVVNPALPPLITQPSASYLPDPAGTAPDIHHPPPYVDKVKARNAQRWSEVRSVPQRWLCACIYALALGHVCLLNAWDCLISSVQLSETLRRNLLSFLTDTTDNCSTWKAQGTHAPLSRWN